MFTMKNNQLTLKYKFDGFTIGQQNNSYIYAIL